MAVRRAWRHGPWVRPAGMVLAASLAGCAGADPSGQAEGDFARYRAQPHYRAMAVTGGALGQTSYAAGWSSAATSIDGAIEVAMRECEARRVSDFQPPCELYAVGDLVVAGADAPTLATAKCVYILEPAARSYRGGYAEACAATMASLPPAGAAIAGSAGGVLDEPAVRARIIGNTMAVDTSAYLFLAQSGAATLRTADSVFGPDVGAWRVDPDGRLCVRWQRAKAGRELCDPVMERGDAYALGDLGFAVIHDNPFEL